MINFQEYQEFKDMYDNAKSILNSSNHIINYYRQNYDKTILNSFYFIADMPPYITNTLKSKTQKLKLSMDSLLKNMIEHPEITFQEYLQLEYFLYNAEYILLKNEKNLIYFKIDNCLYQFVIKNTKDERENFLTTFHKTNIKQLNKDIARYKQIKR